MTYSLSHFLSCLFFLVLLPFCHCVPHVPPKTGINRYVVDDLPGLLDIPKVLRPTMHAGHINIHELNHTNYFFWRFDQPEASSEKLVIWLNGGPGCLSMDGALMEVGPLRLTPDGLVYFNNGTWLELALLVFLDQPVGTGFSYGDNYHTELNEVAFDFVIFLEKYYSLFPQDRKKDLYIAGESYAGQYMPYFARYILDHNKNGDLYPLKGLVIGNGWISATYTGLLYIPFAMENGLVTGKESFLNPVYKQQEKCQNGVNSLNKDSPQEQKNAVYKDCDHILTTLLDVLKNNDENLMCVNMYDVRLTDTYPSCGMNWPPDLPYLYTFLSDESIQAKLNLDRAFFEKEKSDPSNPHLGETYWKECNNRVGLTLTNQHSKSSDELLLGVLEELPVVLFNGDKDIICNYIGAENFIRDLTWNGKKGFSDSVDIKEWFYNGSSVGQIQSERNLTYVRVYNTSHMVPFDMPDVSRGVLDYASGNYDVANNTIVTPVYNVSSSTYYYIHIWDKSKARLQEFFQVRYILYVVILGVILYGLYYYNSKVPNNGRKSILANRKENSITAARTAVLSGIGLQRAKPVKKKTVQWADQQSPETPDSDGSIGRYRDEGDLSGKSSTGISGFFKKLGLSRDKVQYHRASNFDAEEEIEMVDQLDGLPGEDRLSEEGRLSEESGHLEEDRFRIDDEE